MQRYSDPEYWRDEQLWDVPTFVTVKKGPRFIFLLQAVHMLGSRLYPYWPEITQIYRNRSLVLKSKDPDYSESLHLLLSRCSRSYIAKPDEFTENFQKHFYAFSQEDKNLAASIGRHLDDVPAAHASAYHNVLKTLTELFASSKLTTYLIERYDLFDDACWSLSEPEHGFDFKIVFDKEPFNEIILPKATERDFWSDKYFLPKICPAGIWNGQQRRTDARFVFGEVNIEEGNATDDVKGGFRIFVDKSQFEGWLNSAYPPPSSSTDTQTDEKQMTVAEYIMEKLKAFDASGGTFKAAQKQIKTLLAANHPAVTLEDIRLVARSKDEVFSRFFRRGSQPVDEVVDPTRLAASRLSEIYVAAQNDRGDAAGVKTPETPASSD